MTIEIAKDILGKIVTFTLQNSNILDEERSNNLNKLKKYIEESKNILGDIKGLLKGSNSEDNYLYIKYLKDIIKDIKVKYLDICSVLASDLDIELKQEFFTKLTNKEKINYLEDKKSIDIETIKLLNEVLKEKNKENFLNEIVINKDILEKIKNGSLVINSDNINKKHLEIEDFYRKVNGYSLSKGILKYYYLSNDFCEFIKRNNNIIPYLDNYSISLDQIDNNALNLLVLEYPLLLLKLDTIISTNNLSIETLIKIEKKNNIIAKHILISKGYYEEKEFNISLLDNSEDHTLFLYPRNNKEIIRTILNNYKYLKKFSFLSIVSILKNYALEDEIVNLLRNAEFILEVDSIYLEEILNNAGLKIAFNMLQNINILNKVNNLDLKIIDNEKIFVKGFLDSFLLVNKSRHSMLKRMLELLDNNDIENYLFKPYIINKLTNNEIIFLSTKIRINANSIYQNKELILRFTNKDYRMLIDKMWEIWGLDFTYILDNKIFKIVYNKDLESFKKEEIEEIKYLMQLVYSRSNNLVIDPYINVNSFKALIVAYQIMGIKELEKFILNGNKLVSFEEVRDLERKYIDKLSQEFWDNLDSKNEVNTYLEEIEKLNVIYYHNIELLDKLIRDNEILNSLLDLMDTYNYSSRKNSLDIIKEYFDYATYDKDKAKKNLEDFLQRFNAYLYKFKRKELKYNFEEKILENYQLKDEVRLRKQKRLGKDFLDKCKFRILVKSLSNLGNTKYKNYYLNEEIFNNLEEEYKKIISKEDFNLEDILTNILIPYSNNSNIYECLEKKNILMPKMYLKYMEKNNEEKNIADINNSLEKLLKGMHKTRVIVILNYICYHSPINFRIDEKLENKIEEIRKVIINLQGKVDVNKSLLRLDYTSIIYFDNEEEILEYMEYVKIVEDIIVKSMRFASRVISEAEVKATFRKEYTIFINDISFDYSINKKNYELNERMYLLRDIYRIFKDIDFDTILKSDRISELLFSNNNLVMIAEGYYDQFLVYFKDILENINNYNTNNLIDLFLSVSKHEKTDLTLC